MAFHGEPSMERKTISWKALRTLNVARWRPWLCMGDFNEILLGGEKEGATKGSNVLGPILLSFGGL